MIIAKKHKAALLSLRNPGKITSILPMTKEVTVKGNTMVAVPHTEDAVKVLRNLGIDVPAPILYYYSWPRDEYSIPEPFAAQYETAAFLSLINRGYCLNGLGSGKTLAALWAYDNLRQRCKAGKMLIVSPLSTLELTWADTLMQHFPHLDYLVLHASKKKRLQMLQEDVDVYITNHHGAKILEPELRKRGDITLVVVDEISQCARNARTDIWKALNAIVNCHDKPRMCWGLTATPTPNEPTDAWAQARLVTPETVPKYFTRFRDRVMKQIGTYQWIPREGAIDMVYEALSPAIRFSREECIDLPPTTFTDRHVPLTKEQQHYYKEMETKLMAEVDDGQITAANEAVKAGKLVQIACGVLYSSQLNETAVIPNKPRIDETLQLIKDSQSKVIVFCPFVAVVEHVAEAVRAAGYRVGVVHGKVSKSARDIVFSGFQHTDDIDVIVAQPAAMSHGLTLTAADTVIWYAPVTSADVFEQANGRITRPGQKHNTLIAMISGTPVERKMFMRLKNKQKMQNLLLDKVVDGRAA
jgi:SNF2 family DNA or RNA helicase